MYSLHIEQNYYKIKSNICEDIHNILLLDNFFDILIFLKLTTSQIKKIHKFQIPNHYHTYITIGFLEKW